MSTIKCLGRKALLNNTLVNSDKKKKIHTTTVMEILHAFTKWHQHYY